MHAPSPPPHGSGAGAEAGATGTGDFAGHPATGLTNGDTAVVPDTTVTSPADPVVVGTGHNGKEFGNGGDNSSEFANGGNSSVGESGLNKTEHYSQMNGTCCFRIGGGTATLPACCLTLLNASDSEACFNAEAEEGAEVGFNITRCPFDAAEAHVWIQTSEDAKETPHLEDFPNSPFAMSPGEGKPLGSGDGGEDGADGGGADDEEHGGGAAGAGAGAEAGGGDAGASDGGDAGGDAEASGGGASGGDDDDQ